MAVLVYYGSQIANTTTDHFILIKTEGILLKTLCDLLHRVYPTYEVYTTGINDLLIRMHTWLGFPIFNEMVEHASHGRLHEIIKKRRLYLRNKTFPFKQFSCSPTDDQELNRLATSLRETSNFTEISTRLHDTVFLRRTWIQQMNNDPGLERGVATTFFHKFPIYNTRLDLLHRDYEVVMRDIYGHVPDVVATLTLYAPTIIYYAFLNSIDLPDNENDDCLKALYILPSLIKKFSPRCHQQTIEYLYIETDNLNLNGALVQRRSLTTCPSLVATNCGGRRTFFVAVDDFALHTASTNISQAMQRLFEVYYVLDLVYDAAMKDLFGLLEYLMNMKPAANLGVIKLAATLNDCLKNPPKNFSQIFSTFTATSTTTATIPADIQGTCLFSNLLA
uniref:Uncharacterized protein n=1 Tax=Panagrolaimus superbus TaxID=310955 RepID=A0A914YUJ6_9BILA